MPATRRDDAFSPGLTHVARSIGADEAAEVARALYGIEASPVRLGGEKDANFRVTAGGRSFLLKIIAGEDPAVCDMQTAALLHVEATDPGLPIQRVVRSLDGEAQRSRTFGPGDERIVRLVTYVDGVMQRTVPQSPTQRANAGAMLARLQIALKDFRHPAEEHKLTWDLQHAGDLIATAEGMEDGARLAAVLRRFAADVLGRARDLPRQAVHNDLNSDNIVVDPQDHDRVIGLIDFGDMVRTARVFDLAIGAAYQATDTEDPCAACLDFIGGFSRQVALTKAECDVLAGAILARMAVRIAITESRAALFPENRAYILRNTPSARRQFDRLHRLPEGQMTAAIHALVTP